MRRRVLLVGLVAAVALITAGTLAGLASRSSSGDVALAATFTAPSPDTMVLSIESADGRLVAASGASANTGTVYVWNPASRNVITLTRSSPEIAQPAAFSSDDKSILVGYFRSDGSAVGSAFAYYWVNIATNRATRAAWADPLTGPPPEASISQDGSTLAIPSSQDGMIEILDGQTGAITGYLHSPVRSPASVQLDSNGRVILIGGTDGHAFVMNVTSGQVIDQITFNSQDAVLLSPNGQSVLIFERGYPVSLWNTSRRANVTPRDEFWQRYEPRTVADYSGAVAYSNDGGTLFACAEKIGRCDLWNATTGSHIRTLVIPGLGSYEDLRFESNDLVADGAERHGSPTQLFLLEFK
jgi:WD40 repeat protein